MKKLFGLFLISLSCACAATLAACKKDETDNRPTVTVTFAQGEGFTYELVTGETAEENADNAESAADRGAPEKQDEEPLASVEVKQGDTLSFRLDVGAFYAGTPTVLAGDVAVSSVDDVYSFTVNADTTVSVDGIQKDVSNMIGTGASDNAFLVTRPIDLLYIAEQVNAGNETYAAASYVLGADIDCKGEELDIIGDLSTDQSFFSGVFACYTDSSTGEMSRYTISNFVINSDDSQYVGLFGCVQTNLTTQSSGLFYGIRLENFTINAGTENMKTGQPVIYAGGLIGYSVGATVYLCDAVNGEMNLYADDNYFAFAGGLIGCQQGYYAQEYNLPNASELAYSTVDVDVTSVKGATLYAGGVSGYTFTNSLVAPVFIHNVAATGTVSGAINAGGIVGGLGQYTSVSTAYSTGDVIAYSNNTINPNTPYSTDDTYCHSYAGGLVGYAENDTIVNDCFTTGATLATAEMGANYAHTGAFVGSGAAAGAAGVNAQRYIDDIANLSSVNINDEAFADFKTNLGWRDADWTFAAGAYPAINYETSTEDITTTLKINYIAKDGAEIKVNNAKFTEHSYNNGYETIMTAFNNGSIPLYIEADEIAGKNYRSYGYYFDAACTKPVPYAYLSTRNVELYAGFADYTPVDDTTYYVDGGDEVIALKLTTDGYAEYTDGNAAIKVRYQYDGETILIEGATFAKFYTGAVDPDQSVNEDASFDMNRYNAYYFEGIVTNEGIKLYDGTYFTKDSPILASKTELTPDAGETVTAPLGNWYDPNLKATVTLGDLTNQVGKATLEYADGTKYELDYEPAKTDGYYVLYYVYDQTVGGVTSTYKTAFGYFTHDEANKALVSVITDHTEMTTGYNNFTLLMVDEYKGDWVTANTEAFGDIVFNFNGGGYFNGNYKGWLKLGDEVVPYTIDFETQTGSFAYNGLQYTLTIAQDGSSVTIAATDNSTSATLVGTDEFFAYESFVAFDTETFTISETTYEFNGRSNTGNGMINGTIPYTAADLTKRDGYYEWNGLKLYPTNELMGDWAMSGEFDSFKIGPSDLNGNIYAQFKGKTVMIEQLDPAVWSFSTRLDNMPVTYYLFLLYGERETGVEGETEEYLSGFALTQYTSLAYNQYTICSPADEMFGTWSMTETFEGEERVYRTLSFDGVSFDPTGRYSFGTANMSYAGAPTPYNYIQTTNGKLLLWSQTTLLGYTRYYTLVGYNYDADENAWFDVNGDAVTLPANAYVNENKTRAFTLKEVDAVMDTVAKDKSGVSYTFDGGNVNGNEGTVVSSSGKTYSYKLTAYDSATSSWTIAMTDKSSKKQYTATMFTGNPDNVTITLTALA